MAKNRETWEPPQLTVYQTRVMEQIPLDRKQGITEQAIADAMYGDGTPHGPPIKRALNALENMGLIYSKLNWYRYWTWHRTARTFIPKEGKT
jgi:hypothetical protein